MMRHDGLPGQTHQLGAGGLRIRSSVARCCSCSILRTLLFGTLLLFHFAIADITLVAVDCSSASCSMFGATAKGVDTPSCNTYPTCTNLRT